MAETPEVKPTNPLMNIISGVTNIADRFSKVFVEERKNRARIETEKLEAERALLFKGKCTTQMVSQLYRIDKRLQELRSYLKNM
jgi:hypothetical protein